MMQARRNGEAAMHMGPSRRRARKKNNNNNPAAAAVDLSFFPQELVEMIIKSMPVDQAARMSVLSTAFRHSWKECKNLIFDESFYTNRDELQAIESVRKALENHSGIGIKKFYLYMYTIDDIGEAKIHECLDMLELMDVDEIELDLGKYSISKGLLNVKSVRVLKLRRVVFIYTPDQISGFTNLTTLVLKKVDFFYGVDLFELIIAQCLKLEVLEISHCRRIPFLRISASKHESFRVLKIDNCKKPSQIDISAPSLGSFYYHGNVLKIHFLGSHPNLDHVVTTFVRPEVSTTQFESKYFLEDVQDVRRLSINSAVLEGLCSNLTAATKLGFKLRNLTELQVHFEGSNDSDPYDVAILAVNCPHLERLYIDLGNYSFKSSKKVHLLRESHFLKHLKLLYVKGYKSQLCEADAVRRILMMASSISTVALVTPRNYSYCRNKMMFDLYPWKPTQQINFKIHDSGNSREISPTHEMRSWWWNRRNND